MLPFPAAGIVRLPLGACLIAWAIVAVLLFSAVLPVWALVVEGRRAAADRLATSLVWTAFLVALVPLVSLLWTVLVKGAGAINGTFLTYSFYRTSMDQPVGIYHAIVGTLMITLFPAIISVPIGLMAAIYLVEYCEGSHNDDTTTFMVDVSS